jgi:hypothetical protein
MNTGIEEKLRLWCIQRATIESCPDRKGVDSLLTFDYMGSSEFEWGALKASLKRLRAKVNDFRFYDIPLQRSDSKGKKVNITLFCLPDHAVAIEKFIQQCAQGNEPPLKEHTYLGHAVDPSAYKWKTRINCWWDIYNDWVAWIKNDVFADQFIAELRKEIV